MFLHTYSFYCPNTGMCFTYLTLSMLWYRMCFYIADHFSVGIPDCVLTYLTLFSAVVRDCVFTLPFACGIMKLCFHAPNPFSAWYAIVLLHTYTIFWGSTGLCFDVLNPLPAVIRGCFYAVKSLSTVIRGCVFTYLTLYLPWYGAVFTQLNLCLP